MSKSPIPAFLLFPFFLCTFSAPTNAQIGDFFLEQVPLDQTPSEQKPFVKNEFAETLSAELRGQIPQKEKVATTFAPKRDSRSSEDKNNAFASKFWNYLLANNYKHWSPPGSRPADFHAPTNQEGSQANPNPHGPLQKVYVNRKAAGDPNNMPEGSIVVLENYNTDRSLKTISVMYRSPGFNPTANDWFWIDYNPDGSVATKWKYQTAEKTRIDENGVQQTFAGAPKRVPRKMAGRATSCIQCHQSSTDNDFAFFNDRATGVRQIVTASTKNSDVVLSR